MLYFIGLRLLTMNDNKTQKRYRFISFKSTVLIAAIILIVFVLTLSILKNNSGLYDVFETYSSSLISLIAVVGLVYGSKVSIIYGRRVYVAWILIASAQLSNTVGNIITGIFEVGLNQFPPTLWIDMTFIVYFLLFAAGIFLLPRSKLVQDRWSKLLIDVTIVFISVFLIAWTFFINPLFGGTAGIFDATIKLSSIVLYITLLFLIIDLMIGQTKKFHKAPLIFLATSLVFQIVSSVLGIYLPFAQSPEMSLIIDTALIISYLSIFLAGILQADSVNFEKPSISRNYNPWYLRSNTTFYFPSIGVIFAYSILIWSNNQNMHGEFIVLELGVGLIISLLLVRQILSLTENKKLYLEAQDEIIRRKKVESEIESSLKEKETLLKEIHHRVKNNMQVIISLMNLQSRYLDDDTAKEVLKESQNRVKSMANVHERLYQSTNLSSINFGEYIHSLASDLFRSYGSNENIELEFRVKNIPLEIDSAIPCGLIINEILSNSFKHAFPGDMKGVIIIGFDLVDDNYILTISDNGAGFPEEFVLEKSNSLGMLLINTLVVQLDGDIKLDKRDGTSFKIVFPRIKNLDP